MTVQTGRFPHPTPAGNGRGPGRGQQQHGGGRLKRGDLRESSIDETGERISIATGSQDGDGSLVGHWWAGGSERTTSERATSERAEPNSAGGSQSGGFDYTKSRMF